MPKVGTNPVPSLIPSKKIVKREPVWTGPCGEGPNGGITFSALSRFLTCPERFRVRMIEGLKPLDKFSHRMEYGQMWHACEEALAAKKPWDVALKTYTVGLMAKYPMDREQVTHWSNVCRRQFPRYIAYWAKHPDVKDRTPLFQEKTFDVPYHLPSGRIVRLRGKWDAVDLIGKGTAKGVWLQENKTKGDIDETELKRQLKFDLQVMIYLVALNEHYTGYSSIKGVRYNVVRRKVTIKRHEGKQLKNGFKSPESWEDYYNRVEQYFIDDPGHYFMRWQVEVSPKDIERFRRETLDPILERLCNWYDMVSTRNNPFSPSNNKDHYLHWRHPFGCVNSIDEYGWADVDYYLENGDTAGLRREPTLFTELQ